MAHLAHLPWCALLTRRNGLAAASRRQKEKGKELRVDRLAPECKLSSSRPARRSGGMGSTMTWWSFCQKTTRNNSTRPSAYPVHNGAGQERGNPYRTFLRGATVLCKISLSCTQLPSIQMPSQAKAGRTHLLRPRKPSQCWYSLPFRSVEATLMTSRHDQKGSLRVRKTPYNLNDGPY